MNEYAVYREEMGRYYDTRKALYSWRNYKIPTQVSVIEALQMLKPNDKQTIEELQRWLQTCRTLIRNLHKVVVAVGGDDRQTSPS